MRNWMRAPSANSKAHALAISPLVQGFMIATAQWVVFLIRFHILDGIEVVYMLKRLVPWRMRQGGMPLWSTSTNVHMYGTKGESRRSSSLWENTPSSTNR